MVEIKIEQMSDADVRISRGRRSNYDPVVIEAGKLKPGQRFKVPLPKNGPFESSQQFRNSLNVSFRSRFENLNPGKSVAEWRLFALANEGGVEVYRMTAAELAERAAAESAKPKAKPGKKGK